MTINRVETMCNTKLFFVCSDVFCLTGIEQVDSSDEDDNVDAAAAELPNSDQGVLARISYIIDLCCENGNLKIQTLIAKNIVYPVTIMQTYTY